MTDLQVPDYDTALDWLNRNQRLPLQRSQRRLMNRRVWELTISQDGRVYEPRVYFRNKRAALHWAQRYPGATVGLRTNLDRHNFAVCQRYEHSPLFSFLISAATLEELMIF